MIYLIKSAAFIGDTDNTEIILKIGYCGEDSKKARFSAYLTENPTMKVLYLIPGGTEQDERNLHYHFRNFKKPYGNEWFSYSPEILEFFQSHTTKESLKTLKTKLEVRMKSKLKEENPEVEIWVKAIMEVVYKDSDLIKKQEISNDLLNDFLVNHKNLQGYIQSRFPDSYEEIEEAYKELTKPLSPEIQEYLEKFNSISTFPDKLRYLQDVFVLLNNPLSFDAFLFQIPQIFKNYYLVLGPERCKAFGYSNYYLKKEYDKLLNNQSINTNEVDEIIYQSFEIGKRYFKSDIKEILKNIYLSKNYQKTPKASDLQEYFEVKIYQATNPKSGKKENGFEILNKKRVD